MNPDTRAEVEGRDERADDTEVSFVDAATRVSTDGNAFDRWYYGIEDRLGQGTVGMGVCFIVFILVLVFAALFNPI